MTIEQKLEIAIKALRDVVNPLHAIRASLKPGEQLHGLRCIAIQDNPQTYRAIAQRGLLRLRRSTKHP